MASVRYTAHYTRFFIYLKKKKKKEMNTEWKLQLDFIFCILCVRKVLVSVREKCESQPGS